MKDKLFRLIPPVVYLTVLVLGFLVYKEQVDYQFLLWAVLLIGTSFYEIYDTLFIVKNKFLKILFQIFLVIILIAILIFTTYEIRYFSIILIPFLLYSVYKISKV